MLTALEPVEPTHRFWSDEFRAISLVGRVGDYWNSMRSCSLDFSDRILGVFVVHPTSTLNATVRGALVCFVSNERSK